MVTISIFSPDNVLMGVCEAFIIPHGRSSVGRATWDLSARVPVPAGTGPEGNPALGIVLEMCLDCAARHLARVPARPS
jgi:hypothetical protein